MSRLVVSRNDYTLSIAAAIPVMGAITASVATVLAFAFASFVSCSELTNLRPTVRGLRGHQCLEHVALLAFWHSRVLPTCFPTKVPGSLSCISKHGRLLAWTTSLRRYTACTFSGSMRLELMEAVLSGFQYHGNPLRLDLP